MGRDRTLRILTCSDYVGCPSGFGTQHTIMARALAYSRYEVFSAGIHDTRPVHQDTRGLLCWPLGDNGIEGVTDRLEGLCEALRPHMVITLGDPWMFEPLFEHEGRRPFTWLHWLPVDGGGYPVGLEWDEKLVRPDWLVFMSEFGEREYRPHVEGRVRIANIGHGVDTDVFKPVTKRQKATLRAHWQEWLKGAELEGRHVLVNWDTNQWRKNQPALLQMLRHLPEEYVLVLHCSEAPRSKTHGFELAKLAKHRYGVADRVFFTGRGRAEPAQRLAMSEERLATLIQMADVRVSSTTGEGFGIPTIEALACGVPCVLPDNTTGPELTTGGRCGMLAPCGPGVVQPGTWIERFYVDPEAMARQVAWLAQQPKWCARARRAGLKRVRERYTTQVIGQAWADLVQEISE